ncbi:MAG: hypothetical protein CVV44_03915 [Spirochaetae bacterium HGW-Spirochaetae-1]|nr:MAG: hypothetical protein CVV44_03915 [Spirochaetae bacterium HGW-Spirochaetae-1]
MDQSVFQTLLAALNGFAVDNARYVYLVAVLVVAIVRQVMKMFSGWLERLSREQESVKREFDELRDYTLGELRAMNELRADIEERRFEKMQELRDRLTKIESKIN